MAIAEGDGRLPAEDAWEAGPPPGLAAPSGAVVAASRGAAAEVVEIDDGDEGDPEELKRQRAAQALLQALTADDADGEAADSAGTSGELAAAVGDQPVEAAQEPGIRARSELTLDSFLGEWFDSIGHHVQVMQGTVEGMLDVALTKKRGGRGPIKLRVTDQGNGSFACGQYSLNVAESSAKQMVWVHHRLPHITSTWMREPPEDVAATNPAALGLRPPPTSGADPFVVDFEASGGDDGEKPESELARSDPYPYLTQYYTRQRKQLQETKSRYYAGAGQCTDDGHPERSAMRNRCTICLDPSHMVRDCPRMRCQICFCEGHEASECGRVLERDGFTERLQACWTEALSAVAMEDEDGAPAGDSVVVRCFACGAVGAGHTNCVEGPYLPPEPEPEQGQGADEEMLGGPFDEKAAEDEAGEPQRKRQRCGGAEGEEAEAAEEQAEAGVAAAAPAAGADEATALFARWAEPCKLGVPEPAAAAGGAGSASGPSARGGSGLVAAGALEKAVLRLLVEGGGQEGPWREELCAAPTAAVASAARGLWRSGAILPGAAQGFAPQLSALGHWLAPLQTSPWAARALLHGALWGVLLPMAALVVLLESVPPDLALGDGKTPPRKSGHFALAAAYFRWREGRETGLARRFGANIFWETVDQRIVAICKHAQEALRYDGDDAAFEEMEGELMDVRRRDARPWTCASAFGGESSTRWARFLAALSAAFVPQPGDKPGDWLVRTTLGEGVAPLETSVAAGHALLFGPGELPEEGQASQLELDGVRGALCGGEGALEEARALRQELGERLAQSLEGGAGGSGRPRAQQLEEGVVGQALQFAGSSASEFVPARTSSSEPTRPRDDVGAGVLAMLGRQLDEASGAGGTSGGSVGSRALPAGASSGGSSAAPVPRKEAAILELAASCLAQPTAMALPVEPGGEADVAAGRQGKGVPAPPCPEPEDAPMDGGSGGAGFPEATLGAGGNAAADLPAQEWYAALARVALLRALKKQAVAVEDYSLAAKFKAAEGGAEAAAAAARDRAGAGGSAQRAAALERLAARKKKAVEEEDYDLAAQLKQQEAELAARPSPPAAGELERVRAQKAEAIAKEDYGRATSLRERQMELEASWRRFEGIPRAQAADMLADPARRRSLLAPTDSWAASVGAAAWAAAEKELRAPPPPLVLA